MKKPKKPLSAEKAALYREILALPDPLSVIFKRWPDQIPRALIRRLPSSMKSDFYGRLKKRNEEREQARWDREDEAYRQAMETAYVAHARAQVQEAQASPYVKSHRAILDMLERVIQDLPGNKILTWTLSYADGQQSHVKYLHTGDVDIQDQGGWDREGQAIFRHVLARAIHYRGEGGLVLRQFLPTTFMGKHGNGMPIILPEKRVYGLRLEEGKIAPIDAEHMRWAHETDAKTGQPLAPEQGISYGELPQLRAFLSSVS